MSTTHTRRSFVRTAATTVAAASVLLPQLGAAHHKSKKVKVAVIGTGGRSNRDIPNFIKACGLLGLEAEIVMLADAFADNGDGRGITWGLCHIMDRETGVSNSILARFDCDLSLDVNRDFFKHNNLRFNDQTYFQKSTHYNGDLKKQVEQQDMPTKAHP